MKCETHRKELVVKIINGKECFVCETCLIETIARLKRDAFGGGDIGGGDTLNRDLSNLYCPFHKIALTKNGICSRCQSSIQNCSLGMPKRDKQGRFIKDGDK